MMEIWNCEKWYLFMLLYMVHAECGKKMFKVFGEKNIQKTTILGTNGHEMNFFMCFVTSIMEKIYKSNTVV